MIRGKGMFTFLDLPPRTPTFEGGGGGKLPTMFKITLDYPKHMSQSAFYNFEKVKVNRGGGGSDRTTCRKKNSLRSP